MNPRGRIIRRACLFACALFLGGMASGCSTFNREWKAAAVAADPANDISGRWQGSWLSDANQHTGKLRCLVTKLDNHKYRARYHAIYWKILRFSYTVDLNAEERMGRYEFKGSADLGKLAGGVYSYEGHATPTNFFSTYLSKYDHGTFQMTRLGLFPSR